MFSGKKVVVTGSRGFVGKKLVKRLKKENAEVIELDIINGHKLTDLSAVKQIKNFELLFHLAAKIFIPNS